jgi:phage gp36-like protein
MITQEDIETRLSDESTLIELTDLDNTSTVDPVIVDRAVSTAQGLVEAYITLSDPLSTIQTSVLVDLAVYYLFLWAAQRRQGDVSDSVRDSYKDALALLKQLQKNQLVSDPDADADPNAGAIWSSGDPVFYPDGDGCGEVF